MKANVSNLCYLLYFYMYTFKEKAQNKSKAGNIKSQFRTVGIGYQLKQKRNKQQVCICCAWPNNCTNQ